MQKKMNEMESLKNELKNQELTLERIKIEKIELAQKLHENCEEMKFITKERNDLKKLQESFEVERNKLKEHIRQIEATVSHGLSFHLLNVFLKTESIGKGAAVWMMFSQLFFKSHFLIKGLETKEELQMAHMYLKEHQETIEELRRDVSEKTAQIINTQKNLEKSGTELHEKVCPFFFPSFLLFLLSFPFLSPLKER